MPRPPKLSREEVARRTALYDRARKLRLRAESPETLRAKKRAYRLRRRERNKLFVLKYKEAHPCVDCGERDPRKLDFDHRDPKTKTKRVTDARNDSRKKLLAEIAKCDIRCKTCHKIQNTAQNISGEVRRARKVSLDDARSILAFQGHETATMTASRFGISVAHVTRIWKGETHLALWGPLVILYLAVVRKTHAIV